MRRQYTTSTERLSACLIFGILYVVCFYVVRFSEGLGLTQGYAPGISLIYLPSGIKLLAALIAGFWGVLGTVIALACVAPLFWPDKALLFYLLYASVSGFITLMVVDLMLRWLRIRSDLSNLKIVHLPLIDVIATLVHGFAVNLFFLTMGTVEVEGLLGLRSVAMALGDFTGGLVVFFVFIGAVKFHAYRRDVRAGGAPDRD